MQITDYSLGIHYIFHRVHWVLNCLRKRKHCDLAWVTYGRVYIHRGQSSKLNPAQVIIIYDLLFCFVISLGHSYIWVLDRHFSLFSNYMYSLLESIKKLRFKSLRFWLFNEARYRWLLSALYRIVLCLISKLIFYLMNSSLISSHGSWHTIVPLIVKKF